MTEKPLTCANPWCIERARPGGLYCGPRCAKMLSNDRARDRRREAKQPSAAEAKP